MINYILVKISPIFLALVMLSFIGCNNNTLNDTNEQKYFESSKNIKVQLIDTLGWVSLSIPLRYDTCFSWIYYSDCGKDCNEHRYRFQPKKLPIVKESGWIWKGKYVDSIENFTISHSEYFPFYVGDTAKNIVRHNHLIEQLISNLQNPPIIFDTIQKINDRYYSIIIMEKNDTLYSKKVVAETTIKNNEIKFEYELLTDQNDSITKNFVKNSINLIKTIRIQKGI